MTTCSNVDTENEVPAPTLYTRKKEFQMPEIWPRDARCVTPPFFPAETGVSTKVLPFTAVLEHIRAIFPVVMLLEQLSAGKCNCIRTV